MRSMIILTNQKKKMNKKISKKNQKSTKQSNKKMDKKMAIQICMAYYNCVVLEQTGKVYKIHHSENYQSKIIQKQSVNLIDSKWFNHEKVVQICCNDKVYFALTEKGNIYQWMDVCGNQNIPKQILLNSIKDRVFSIYTNSNLCLIANTEKEIYKLDYDDCFDNISPIKPELFFKIHKSETIKKTSFTSQQIVSLTVSGNLYISSSNQISPTHFMNEKVLDIDNGKDFFLALTQNGKLYTWGGNTFGQLGLGHFNNALYPHPIDMSIFENDKIKTIGCGLFWCYVTTQSNKVYVWGEDVQHDSNTGKCYKISKPTQINDFRLKNQMVVQMNGSRNTRSDNHSFVITEKGKIFTWQKNNQKQNEPKRLVPFMSEFFGCTTKQNNLNMYKNDCYNDASFEFQ